MPKKCLVEQHHATSGPFRCQGCREPLRGLSNGPVAVAGSLFPGLAGDPGGCCRGNPYKTMP